ncbi:NUDIX hydrolase [Ferdinandcohnia quinoae]|uniref:NUDIX hydrolase n=1 Tax=Fredinandcohnia quinoae TaxID=2918902 RepID=A0AAW5E8Q1_9BACI|nr:NUDIX hydrolase [Fredinandcohnia sp. SECRCQ15]MCH1626406.1 NUDIX hydrolase [Fredinandcohnia sp. SECRCQ15]
MEKWYGAAGICVNEHNQILMVLQGKPEEKKVWSVPSGGKESSETFEQCCIREIKEETGYDVKIVRPIYKKVGITYGIEVEVQYFEVGVIGGKQCIQDPDNLIYEIAWKSANELLELELSFPEDRELLLDFTYGKGNLHNESTSSYFKR